MLDEVLNDNYDGNLSTNNKELETASWIHYSAVLGLLIPPAHIIIPLVLWLVKKDESEIIDTQGVEAINFQISMFIYYIIAGILCFLLVGFLLLPILFIISIVLPLVAGSKTSKGDLYRYPFTIRFL